MKQSPIPIPHLNLPWVWYFSPYHFYSYSGLARLHLPLWSNLDIPWLVTFHTVKLRYNWFLFPAVNTIYIHILWHLCSFVTPCSQMDHCYQCTLVCLAFKVKEQKRGQKRLQEIKCLCWGNTIPCGAKTGKYRNYNPGVQENRKRSIKISLQPSLP